MISKIDKFFINGVSSDTCDLYVDTIILPPMAEEITQEIRIPGREETLIQRDEQYADVPITITAYVFDNKYNINNLYTFLRTALEGKHALMTTLSDQYYYRVKKLLGVTPNYSGHGKTQIAITFMCSPFRYDSDESYDVVTENDSYVLNTGNIFARPIFRIFGQGDITLNVNNSDNPLTIYNIRHSAVVDTEKVLVHTMDLQTIYTTSGNIPLLETGGNLIHWEGDVASIGIVRNLRWL